MVEICRSEENEFEAVKVDASVETTELDASSGFTFFQNIEAFRDLEAEYFVNNCILTSYSSSAILLMICNNAKI